MENSVFTKIINREIPAEIVFEDEHTIAFLDTTPVTIGHTLVIPKKPYVNIFDIPAEELAATMETVRKISPAVRDAVAAKGVHINSNHGVEAGQVVPHLHIHIIPRHDHTEFEDWPLLEQQPIDDVKALAEAIRAKINAHS
jgi:histidine triad (HIT) family protein